MKDWVSCYENWILLSDKILSGTPYLLQSCPRAFIHFSASQEGTNAKHIALEEAIVKQKSKLYTCSDNIRYFSQIQVKHN